MVKPRSLSFTLSETPRMIIHRVFNDNLSVLSSSYIKPRRAAMQHPAQRSGAGYYEVPNLLTTTTCIFPALSASSYRSILTMSYLPYCSLPCHKLSPIRATYMGVDIRHSVKLWFLIVMLLLQLQLEQRSIHARGSTRVYFELLSLSACRCMYVNWCWL